MPFNASGIFERLYSWVADRDNGVKIRADRMDQEMDGFKDAINTITGNQFPQRGGVRGVAGSSTEPSYTFDVDRDTGMYRVSADVLGFSVGGTLKVRVSASNVTFDGHTMWHAGNDGANSGLDADLLHGQNAAYYLNADNINAGTLSDDRLPDTISSDITGNAATATNATNHIADTDNPHEVTKAQVGLANVDNTADTDKPISTATQTALDDKLNLSGGVLTGALTLSAAPTSDLQAATKKYVDDKSSSMTPAGAVMAFAQSTPPTGWLSSVYGLFKIPDHLKA